MEKQKQKQNEFRFTLQLNKNDPNHQFTADVLNKQGKSISNFIVNTVMHYMDCGLHPVSSLFTEQQLTLMMERIMGKAVEQYTAEIVEMALEKYLAGAGPQPQPGTPASAPPPRPAPPPAPEDMDEESLELLGEGLASFR